jgi:UDPglucose 6-dehydrogenase
MRKFKVGFLGLGKLGLPCAMAIESKGHSVCGYDLNPDVKEILATRKLPYREEGSPELLETTKVWHTKDIKELVESSELIFVPIQTPHKPKYEGTTRIPDERVDFDYSYIKSGLRELSLEVDAQGQDKVVVIISTVLPGTVERDLKPLLSEKIKLCYNPFFIAMGTTVNDFLFPEFTLFGVDNSWAAQEAEEFYKTITDAPFAKMSVKSAELTKVAYNTYITSKITIANTLMEICHKIGANVDDVTDALKLGHRRIISPTYFSGGMQDGGGCHPRDNIALSWLARKLDLSYDWFDGLMMARECQTEWLADLMCEHSLPKVILGKAFKQETNLTIGSPSVLLKNLLEERGVKVEMWDPWVDGKEQPKFKKSVFLIGTKHPEFLDMKFPNGSIVIDPWRYIPDQPGNVKVIRIGEEKNE